MALGMKAKLLDREMRYVKTLELTGKDPEIQVREVADVEMDDRRNSLPSEKMKVAKFKIRFYRLITIEDNVLIYVEGKGRFGMPLFDKEAKQQPFIKAPFQKEQ